jgi:zinc protease
MKFTFVSALIATTLGTMLAALPAGIDPVQTLDGIQEYRLTNNGLRILLIPDDGLPVATVMVTYEVGSRNEVTGTTGATHILEHMMFKGTERLNSENGSDYFSQMERIGARSNATTYFDRTNYYATLPSEYVSLAIELEADRMRNLRILEEDLNSEMTVVRNEYERGENNPMRTLVKEIYACAFIAHPYGHPTIGWLSDIEKTSTEKLRAFYNTYYWPENAVLTVIGGFDTEETLTAIEQFYGSVPNATQSIPVVETVEPKQLGPRRLVIERAGQVGIVMVAFKAPEGSSEDWAALTLIEQILGADKTGRLYRALEDKGKASATFTYAPQLRDPGLFTLAAYLTPEATHEETEKIIADEINKLISNGVTVDELEQAKAVIKANVVYGRDGSYAIADQLNETIAMGDWTKYVTQPKAIQAVSAEDIQKVAAKYFTQTNRTTGWFVPGNSAPSTEITGSRLGPNYYRDPEISDTPIEDNTNPSSNDSVVESNSKPAVDFSSNLQRTRIGDIEIIAIDMPITDVVSFVGSFAAGETLSPDDSPTLAGLTAAMLDKGTRRNDRFQIAELLNSIGAGIKFGASAHMLQFSGKFLRKDAGTVIGLLAEQLREPAFDPDVLETLKSRQSAQLLRAIDNPDYQADTLLDRLLYPADHPNYSEEISVLLENLKTVTIEDIVQFHADHYGPKSMQLVFAGDIDFEQLTAAVEFAFEDWNGGVSYPSEHPKQLENTKKSERIFITDKTSIAVRYAQNTGLQRTSEDYLPFMLGNYILGGSFNARLMQEVRVNKGLTYSISSGHTGDILTPGNWILNASFSPALLEQGLTVTESIIAEWYKKGVSQDEVQRAIETLCGSYLVGLSTTSSVAYQTLSFIQRGFAPEYIDEYPEKLRSITSEQVNQAIRKYFDPELNTLVVAGSLADTQTAVVTQPQSIENIAVRLDTPDAGWRIEIKEVYQTSESLVVISQLQHSEEIAAAVISTVSDSVQISEIEEGLPVRHYITGKTWDWGASPEYNFIESMNAFGTALDNARLIYKK